MQPFDAVVIGTSAGGVEAAARLRSQGLSVALVGNAASHEERRERFWRAIAAPEKSAASVLSSFQSRAEALREAGVEIVPGSGHFLSDHEFEADGRRLQGRRWILATGTVPRFPSSKALSPWDALLLDPAPKSVAIVGGGPAGVALALRLSDRGTNATLITAGNTVLTREDTSIQESAERALAALSVRRRRGLRVAVDATGTPTFPNDAEKIDGPFILALGDSAAVDSLALPQAGVHRDAQGAVRVLDDMRTSASRVFAVGGVSGPRTPLELELHQAELAAHNANAPFWNQRRLDPDVATAALPGALGYARLGPTEADARARHPRIVVADVSGTVNGQNARVKLLATRRGHLIGAHLWGPEPSGWALFFDLLQRAGVSMAEVAERQRFPALTGADLLHEAIADALGG